jgi:probable F420-dependent oxidoreductase
MRVEYPLDLDHLRSLPPLIQTLEAVGYDGVATVETRHDPFAPLVLAAEHSQRLQLATGVAIAFPRSPMITAYTAWDLQAFSGGRFALGLGPQVKAHNERRFSVSWSAPVPRLREYILALRAIWACWQHGTPLNFRGQHYTFTLMTPFFTPPPLEHPTIPIHLAAVNPAMARLAGEIADGIRLHPFLSPRYLREVILPAVHDGAARAGRTLVSFTIIGAGFIVTAPHERDLHRQREHVRQQLAFYASTPSYRRVMEVHGWAETADTLAQLARQGRWDAMAAYMTDEMLETFALVTTDAALPERLAERYGGLVDVVQLALPLETPEQQARAAELLARIHAVPEAHAPQP